MSSSLAGDIARILNQLIFTGVLAVLMCLLIYLLVGVIRLYFPDRSISGIAVAGRRLGFEPTMGGLADYISAELEPGMSRDEVESVLSSIGSVVVEQRNALTMPAQAGLLSCDNLSLPLTGQTTDGKPILMPAMPLAACYDGQGGLDYFRYRPGSWESDYPHFNINVPAQRRN
jgi:hypothetical protein